ncbi:MAG: hypothetical protein JWL72_2695 [Ilumatobacteraceae bacterium]|nr:hypothetical protein [Ilumatobacteraceae bacterium]
MQLGQQDGQHVCATGRIDGACSDRGTDGAAEHEPGVIGSRDDDRSRADH